MADVHPEQLTAPDGQRCDAVQRSLAGNHVASVARGRAGPAVRVLLDSAQIPIPVCYDADANAREVSNVSKPRLDDVRPVRVTKLPAGTRMDVVKAWAAHIQTQIKADEVGLPTTMAKLVGPDGTEIEVPTWVAALVAEALDAHKAAGETPAESVAPAEPMAEAEGEPAPKPEEKPMPEEKKPEPMTPDSVQALVRRRGRLERAAATRGMASAVIDAADDVALARAFVAHVTPHAKAIADKAEGAALDALVEVAIATPPKVESNPFEVSIKRDADETKPEDDPIVLSYAAALMR
jgi:hypothetical protein